MYFYVSILRIRKLQCFIVAALMVLSTATLADEWIYTVQQGDNLWNLTKRHLKHMQYVHHLQKLNNIQNPYAMQPGTRLMIPTAWTRMTEIAYAQITNIHGSVFIQRNNQEKKSAELGMQLHADDIVQSENDSFVTIEFADNSKIRVQNNSRIRLKEIQIYGDYGLVDTGIHLDHGRTESSIPKNSTTGTRFRIHTPSAISSVRGTHFRVGTNEPQSETASEVLTGNINVTGAQSNVKLPAGFGTVTALGKPPAPPIALLPPPDLSGTSNYYENLPLIIHLNPLPGAHAYRTQIALDNTFDELISEFTTTTLPFRGGDIPDGDYWLRIRGIDEHGIEGKDVHMPFSLNARPEPPFITAPLPNSVTTPEHQEFSWTTQSKASHYTLMISKNTDFTHVVYFNPEIKTNTMTLSEMLEPGHYFWRIASVSPHEGAGPFSDSIPFRIPYPGPSVEETEIDDDEIAFAWRVAAEGQSDHFQLARDTSFTNIIFDEILTASQITIDKPEGGTYYLRIRTIESDGFKGPWGPYQTIEIPRNIPYWLMLILLLPLFALI